MITRRWRVCQFRLESGAQREMDVDGGVVRAQSHLGVSLDVVVRMRRGVVIPILKLGGEVETKN